MTTAPLDLESSRLTLTPQTVPARISLPNMLLGVAIASLVPALFWASVVWIISRWLGAGISGQVLLGFACSVTLFLTAVCGALLANADRYTRS